MEERGIDSARLYSLREAAALIPSPRGGTLQPQALRQRILDGTLPAEIRLVGKRRFWFIHGSDLRKLLETEPVKATRIEPRVRTEKARRREYEAAMKALGLPLPDGE